MKIKKILEQNAHRPWEIPKDKWRYYQEWNDAIFLHWQVDLKELRKFVPKELEIDLFEGKAWVSICCICYGRNSSKVFAFICSYFKFL